MRRTGPWMVRRDPLDTSEVPFELVITGGNTRTIRDLPVGQLLRAWAQSNMEFGFQVEIYREELTKSAWPTSPIDLAAPDVNT